MFSPGWGAVCFLFLFLGFLSFAVLFVFLVWCFSLVMVFQWLFPGLVVSLLVSSSFSFSPFSFIVFLDFPGQEFACLLFDFLGVFYFVLMALLFFILFGPSCCCSSHVFCISYLCSFLGAWG